MQAADDASADDAAADDASADDAAADDAPADGLIRWAAAMGVSAVGLSAAGLAPQPGMPPALSPPTSAVASPPMMTGTPASLQSQSMSMGGEGAAGGPLAFLSDSRKRTLYLGAIAGALVVGGIGLILTSALRSSGGGKALDAVMDQYVTGTKNFTAGHYDDAKAFQAAAEKAPTSTVLKRYIELCDSEAKMAAALDTAKTRARQAKLRRRAQRV